MSAIQRSDRGRSHGFEYGGVREKSPRPILLHVGEFDLARYLSLIVSRSSLLSLTREYTDSDYGFWEVSSLASLLQ